MTEFLPFNPTPEALDVSRAELFANHEWGAPFRWLRENAPVYRVTESKFGPYWSVSTYDLIREIEGDPGTFSSSHEYGGSITIADRPQAARFPNFIAMDPPQHTPQRGAVAPAFTPTAMKRMRGDVECRTENVLDALPRDEMFDWVEKVSVELTTQMLAILFDFPWDDRHLLPFWSDWAGNIEHFGDPAMQEERLGHLRDMGAYFQHLIDERRGAAAGTDILSLMLQSEVMGNMDMTELIGTLTLLIIGGNDTTRNTMSALALAFEKFPEEFERLVEQPELISNAVSETIRWQTPLAHMRRTATRDVELGGRTIMQGDKVILWYVSANRDEQVFEDADRFDVGRANARRHLAFGHGIHRCVGARVAELQVQVLLEQMVARKMKPRMVAAPVRVAQSFVNGFERLNVRLEK